MATHAGARVLAVLVAFGVLASPVLPAQQTALPDRQEAAREAWQRVDDIFQALAVRPGAVIADIGAGDGFFTVRLARAVGDDGRTQCSVPSDCGTASTAGAAKT